MSRAGKAEKEVQFPPFKDKTYNFTSASSDWPELSQTNTTSLQGGWTIKELFNLGDPVTR